MKNGQGEVQTVTGILYASVFMRSATSPPSFMKVTIENMIIGATFMFLKPEMKFQTRGAWTTLARAFFVAGNATYKPLSVGRSVGHAFTFCMRTAFTAPAQLITAPAQLITAPAQLITAPAQLITAPAQLTSAPA